jgi:hypothetical protein
MPIHVIRSRSGNATEEVRDRIRDVSEALKRHVLIVKYYCADGDRGYNTEHLKYFEEWYRLYHSGGLEAALRYLAESEPIPVGDFLQLWKNFCNKVKNHPVVLSPDSLATILTVEELQALLKLQKELTDK